MAKSSEDTSKTVQRGAYICSACKTEFEGTSCPDCGNTKGNLRLASDGIEHELHKSSHLFNAGNLRPAEDFMISDSQQLERKRVQMQMDELDDNLREAQVIRTQIKMKDQQMALKRKEIEAKKLEEQSTEYMSGRSNTPPSQPQQREEQQQFPNMPFMSNMSPQAVFMQQLMKMDSKKRAELIEQLSEADPGALANLSSMFQQAQPQQQQITQYPNPYGQYPMIPPWMMQQQPQQHQQQAPTDPIALVTSIFELSKQMQPPKDDSMKDMLHEFKDEIKKVHDRMDVVLTRERDKDTNPILEKINHLEQKFNNGGGGKSVVDQVNELTSLVEGLEKAGLVKRSGSADKTIDDELKLKEFDFKRETKNREIQIEESRMEAEKSKSSLTQSIVSSLLQRGIQKGIQAREDEDNPKSGSGSTSRTPTIINRVRTVSAPASVEAISEVTTEGGVVRETRRPVKKTETGGE